MLIRYPEEKTDTSYIIPSSVTTIEANAFKNCDKLKSLILGHNAFSVCDELNNVIIPVHLL